MFGDELLMEEESGRKVKKKERREKGKEKRDGELTGGGSEIACRRDERWRRERENFPKDPV